MKKPLWIPSQDRVDRANLSRFMRFVRNEIGNADLNSYAPLYRFSIDQPEKFWTLLWDFVGIRGSGERAPVLVDHDGMADARWFPDVSLNFAQNLLRFDDDRIAVRCHDVDGEHPQITYGELQRRVAALAAAMRARGVEAGDCIAAVLPNVPDALVATLASACVGATWFACPTSLSPDDAAGLIASLSPKMLFIGEQARGLETGLPEIETVVFVAGAAQASDIPTRAIALQALVVPFADAELEFTPVPFDHALYLTHARMPDGSSEVLLHGTGGTLIQHLKELVLHVDLKREDKIFFHAGNDSMAWYWLVSSLAIGSTLILHAGEELPANDAALWDLVDEYGISVLGLHSHWLDTAARAGLAPMQTHRLMTLKTILTAGSALSPAGYDHVYHQIKERVLLSPISTGGDTLACFALGAPVLPVWRGEISCRGLGMKVEVLDHEGKAVVGERGDLACCAPFPSMPLGFFNDPDKTRYQAAYFSRHEGRWCRGERATLTTRESLVIGH
jgi:acetoacetyl-CoA synthetase